MITANITRSSTIRLNCDFVLSIGLFLVCSSLSWRISRSFDFPPRNDLVSLRRIFVFPNVTRTFLCSRPRNSIKYDRVCYSPVVPRVRSSTERDVLFANDRNFTKIEKHKNVNEIEHEIVLTSIVQSTVTEEQRELPAARITRVTFFRNVYLFIRAHWTGF